MNCYFCSVPITDSRYVSTTFHFWALCCPRCIDKYGERDAQGNYTYKDAAH